MTETGVSRELGYFDPGKDRSAAERHTPVFGSVYGFISHLHRLTTAGIEDEIPGALRGIAREWYDSLPSDASHGFDFTSLQGWIHALQVRWSVMEWLSEDTYISVYDFSCHDPKHTVEFSANYKEIEKMVFREFAKLPEEFHLHFHFRNGDLCDTTTTIYDFYTKLMFYDYKVYAHFIPRTLRSPFLDLDESLRRMIYRHLFSLDNISDNMLRASEGIVEQGDPASLSDCHRIHVTKSTPGILLVSRKVSREASQELYNTPLILRVPDPDEDQITLPLTNLEDFISLPLLRRLKRITVLLPDNASKCERPTDPLAQLRRLLVSPAEGCPLQQAKQLHSLEHLRIRMESADALHLIGHINDKSYGCEESYCKIWATLFYILFVEPQLRLRSAKNLLHVYINDRLLTLDWEIACRR
ncbi:MAG: hypothetical protein Q9165_007969 [Trypethelium subeluteriae]